DGSVVRQISDDGDGFDFKSAFPTGIAAFDGRVWVANPGGESVTELPQSGPATIAATAIHACVSTGTRAVTVPAADSACPTTAKAISWNLPGPAGTGTGSDLDSIFTGTRYQFNDPQAVVTDGTQLWVANTAGNSITEVNASDGSLVRVISDQAFDFESPDALAFDGSNIWVANERGASVTEIS